MTFHLELFLLENRFRRNRLEFSIDIWKINKNKQWKRFCIAC